jgi:hypothetical protein
MDEFETILKDTTHFKKLGFDEFIFEEFQTVLLDVLKGLKKK